jgi:hypothetical protein
MVIMKEQFRSFYRPEGSKFSELWQNGLFVLDTNVLLDLYRYAPSTRDDFFKALRHLSSRLWIPHQVALEYQHRRLSVISEQIGVYDAVRKLVREERHSLIDPDNFIRALNSVCLAFIAQLDELRSKQLDVCDDDPIRTKLDKLFKGRVGKAPASQSELDALYKIAEDRFLKKRPPGYEDADKGQQEPASDNKKQQDDGIARTATKKGRAEHGTILFNGLVYQQKFADYLIWHQILNHVNATKVQWVAFITNEKKEDWQIINKSHGDAKKVLGPRPELIQEMCNAGVSVFHIYNSKRFLELSKEYLGAEVSKQSIEQVNDVSLVILAPGEELRKCEWEHCNKTFIVKTDGRTALRRFCSGLCRGRASEARMGRLA